LYPSKVSDIYGVSITCILPKLAIFWDWQHRWEESPTYPATLWKKEVAYHGSGWESGNKESEEGLQREENASYARGRTVNTL